MGAWRDLARLPRELWIVAATVFVNRLGTMAQPFLLLYLTGHLRLGASTAGLIAGLYGAGSLAAGPLAGWICDRRGPIPLMLGSLFGAGALMLVYPLASGLLALAILTAALGIVAESFRPANMVLIGSLVPPERRKTAFSLVRLAVNLGMSVGPAAGGLLAGIWLPALFLADGATSIAAGLLLAGSSLVRRPSRPAAADASVEPGRRALEDPEFRYFLISVLPAAIAFFYDIAVLPLFLVRELHQPEWVGGLMFTLNTLMIVGLQVPMTAATDHWSSRRELSLGAALFAAGFVLQALSRGVLMSAAGVVLWTFGEMLFLPGMIIYVTQAAPERRRGEYLGLQSLVFGIASVVGPWSGAVLQDRFGGAVLWSTAAVLSLISAGMLLRIRPAEPAR